MGEALSERLRQITIDFSFAHIMGLCREAAARIDALEAENAGLRNRNAIHSNLVSAKATAALRGIQRRLG